MRSKLPPLRSQIIFPKTWIDGPAFGYPAEDGLPIRLRTVWSGGRKPLHLSDVVICGGLIKRTHLGNVLMLIRLLLVTIAVAFTGKIAYADCSAPIAPSCAFRQAEFDDQDDFDRCNRQMQQYRNAVEAYLSCLKRDSDQIISDYNNAIATFNRRAPPR